jgi:hypothetical protein
MDWTKREPDAAGRDVLRGRLRESGDDEAKAGPAPAAPSYDQIVQQDLRDRS